MRTKVCILRKDSVILRISEVWMFWVLNKQVTQSGNGFPGTTGSYAWGEKPDGWSVHSTQAQEPMKESQQLKIKSLPRRTQNNTLNQEAIKFCTTSAWLYSCRTFSWNQKTCIQRVIRFLNSYTSIIHKCIYTILKSPSVLHNNIWG